MSRLLTGTDARSRKALDALWASLPRQPATCWYPSAGNCFRDLLIWRHYPGLHDVPEPDLYIHCDYIDDLPDRDVHDDQYTRITIEARHPLCVDRSIRYRVDPAYASLAGLAADQARAELLHIHVQSHTAGEFRRPVLYFHMENFNWFEECVLARGLRITHLFKLREGCGFGGARASVSNLYPFLAHAGCQWLVCDQEAHMDQRLVKRLISRHTPDDPDPWQIARTIPLGPLSDMDVLAHQLEASERADWLSETAERITRGSAWATTRLQRLSSRKSNGRSPG